MEKAILYRLVLYQLVTKENNSAFKRLALNQAIKL